MATVVITPIFCDCCKQPKLLAKMVGSELQIHGFRRNGRTHYTKKDLRELDKDAHNVLEFLSNVT